MLSKQENKTAKSDHQKTIKYKHTQASNHLLYKKKQPKKKKNVNPGRSKWRGFFISHTQTTLSQQVTAINNRFHLPPSLSSASVKNPNQWSLLAGKKKPAYPFFKVLLANSTGFLAVFRFGTPDFQFFLFYLDL